MTDPIVTHADLPVLRRLRTDTCDPVDGGDCPCPGSALLDRLIAAAEADAPPLPEGWVLHSDTYGAAAFWHYGGVLYERDDCSGEWAEVGSAAAPRDRLTPLRPTIAYVDVEHAIRAARDKFPHAEALGSGHSWAKSVRLIVDVLGVEVVDR